MSYYGPVLVVTAIILLSEIVMGRHRGIYGRNDVLVLGLASRFVRQTTLSRT